MAPRREGFVSRVSGTKAAWPETFLAGFGSAAFADTLEFCTFNPPPG
jgi:hypothetical protein